MVGTVKIPKAEKLPSGSYRVRITINGKRTSFIKDEEQDAVNAAILALLSHDPDEEERQRKLSQVTLRSAVQDYIDKRNRILSPSTVRSYESILNNRLQAVMDLPLTAKIDWQMVVNEEAEEISAKTLKNVWGLIRSVLAEYGIPTGRVRLPQVIKEKRPFLEPYQMIQFVNAIKGHRYELPYLLCLHGLRRSEMMAVTKSDISGNMIHVHGAVVMQKGGKYVHKEENKTETSRRNVPIMVDRLKRLAKASETDLLCPWSPSAMSRSLTKVLKDLGYPDCGLHGLRRSYASLCYHANVSEAQAMEWGGWSDVSTMRKIYIQIAEEDRQKKAEGLKEYFR